MRVFISSVVRGFESHRDATARGIESLGHRVIRSEDLTATPNSPRRACLAGVREADAVVLLLGSRYGAVQASSLSATHEEYREARERKPVFVFVHEGVEMEPSAHAFLREVEGWEAGHTTERFDTSETLQTLVTRALHRWELAGAGAVIDSTEMLERARALVPTHHDWYGGGMICTVVVGAPRQAVLRPARLDDERFRRELHRDAAFGSPAVLDPQGGTETRVEGDALVISQEAASLALHADGSIRLLGALRDRAARDAIALPALIEEDVTERLHDALVFTADLLDRIDEEHRISDVLPLAGLLGASYMGWLTRAESHANTGSVTIGHEAGDIVTVELSLASVKRPALRQRAIELAEDLTVLLRRRIRA